MNQHRSWPKLVSDPDYALTQAELTRTECENYDCGFSNKPPGNPSNAVENFRVPPQIAAWSFAPEHVQRMPCFFLFWLDSTLTTPERFLAYVWGSEPTAEGHSPELAIGKVDHGNLEEYLIRCVRESSAERYCRYCFNNTKILFAKDRVMEKISGGADAAALMKETIFGKYAGS